MTDKKQELEQQIATLENAQRSIAEQMKPLEVANRRIYKSLEKTRNQLADLLAKDGTLDSIEYLINSYSPNVSGKAHYDALRKWGKAVKFRGGYLRETNQPAFYVSIKHDGSNISDSISEIKELMRYLNRSRIRHR